MIDPTAERLARILECIGNTRPNGVEDLRTDDAGIALEAIRQAMRQPNSLGLASPDFRWSLVRAYAAIAFVRAIDGHGLEVATPRRMVGFDDPPL